MFRPSAIFAFARAALVSSAFAGCSASTTASREIDSPNDFGRGATLLVAPGPVDIENVHLPAVIVLPIFPEASNGQCSGVIVDSRIVVTAGHCVCRPRAPTPQDKLPPAKPTKPMREAVLTRARALQDVIITDIVDRRSSCAQTASVTTLAYEPLKPGRRRASAQVTPYEGTVVFHPELELIAGIRHGQRAVFWSNADLAVIILDDPVPPEFPRVKLSDSEVKVGDAFIMAGYGPGDFNKAFGSRHVGGNVVTRSVELDTGNKVFGASALPGPDHEAAHARRGDSGGAAVRKDDPKVLIGIIAMDADAAPGNKITWFTSVYPHRRWISENIPKVELPADAGVSVPGFDAGAPPSLPPAAQ